MTSVVMLEITREVSVNIGLTLKGRAQAWLGHSWTLLETLGNSWTLLETLGHSWKLLDTSGYFWKPLLLENGKLCYIGLWAKFTES